MTEWWFYPTLMCLVLTGIHGYLGIHVLERKVIFVDLAMAQIAALGAAYALWLGYDADHDPNAVYLFSLGFTLVGAAVFALTRMRHEKVPQEAIIGIVYACASAVAILILTKAPTGGEHIEHMLVGNILIVDGQDVIKTALIYSGIGAFHWFFRKRFFDVTRRGVDAPGARWWDFLFYLTFGIVITSSVAVAGVLLVFSYLVVPGVIATLFASKIGPRLGIAWAVGTAVSVLGMFLSFYGEFTTGPSIVTCFAAVLILAALAYALRVGIGVKRVAAGTVLVVMLFGTSTLLRKGSDQDHEHPSKFQALVDDLGSSQEDRVIEAIHHLQESEDPHAANLLLDLLKGGTTDRAFAHAVEALANLGDKSATTFLLSQAGSRNADQRFVLAQAILELREPKGLEVLVGIYQDVDASPFTQEEARQAFEKWTGRPFDRAWWERNRGKLHWREALGRYE